jgi:hypothetical protein
MLPGEQKVPSTRKARPGSPVVGAFRNGAERMAFVQKLKQAFD